MFVGLAIGSGATFLAVTTPWQGDESSVEVAQSEIDGGPIEESVGKVKKRRGKRRRRGGDKDQNESGLQQIDERIELSAADRKMVWRGPAVSKSTQAMDFNGGGESRSLTQGEISQGISPRQNKLSRCIGDARGQAELAAKLTLKFLVPGQGRATKVRVRAPSYLQKHGLYDCVSGVVRSMNFASTGGETVVTLPFELSY